MCVPSKTVFSRAGSSRFAPVKAEVGFSLKDELFNEETVGRFAAWLTGATPNFDEGGFTREVMEPFPELELKQRIAHIAAVMETHLPADFDAAVKVIVDALPERLDPTKTDDDFGEFIIAPFSHFVAVHGATAERLQISLDALREITQRFSAEDAIRTFINAFPVETLAFLQDCAADDNYHVRRLASEGTRPKLPWSGKLTIEHPEPLPILDALFADPTRYVTRSVANHLNDIAKIDPDLVLDTLARWQTTGDQEPAEMDFLIEHACRTLIKDGNGRALSLLGYGEEPDVELTDLVSPTTNVELGSAFEFSFAVTAKRPQKLLVDYTMVFAGPDGEPGGSKVFKLKRLDLAKGESVAIRKKHPMKLMTTRALYDGTHAITIQINGKEMDSLSFDLAVS